MGGKGEKEERSESVTFREKLAIEHPDSLGLNYAGGCCGCPGDYGYPEKRLCNGFRDGAQDCVCSDCWDQEMPETERDTDRHGAAAPRNDSEIVDMVNRPPHYTTGGIECIDAITAALTPHHDPISSWLTGHVLRYMWRWPLKNGAEDLKKARFYLDRLIEREEKKA